MYGALIEMTALAGSATPRITRKSPDISGLLLVTCSHRILQHPRHSEDQSSTSNRCPRERATLVRCSAMASELQSVRIRKQSRCSTRVQEDNGLIRSIATLTNVIDHAGKRFTAVDRIE